jgi:hypothetical protein
MKAVHKPIEVECQVVPFACLIAYQGDTPIQVQEGDVIVRNCLGESYPMSREAFEANYTVVEE